MAPRATIIPRIVKFLFENPAPANLMQISIKMRIGQPGVTIAVQRLEVYGVVVKIPGGSRNEKLIQLAPWFRSWIHDHFGGFPSKEKMYLIHDIALNPDILTTIAGVGRYAAVS